MSQIECECGSVYPLTKLYDPVPDKAFGWIAFEPSDFAALLEDLVTAPDRVALEEALNEIPRRILIECQKCGRLLWEVPDLAGFTVYRKD